MMKYIYLIFLFVAAISCTNHPASTADQKIKHSPITGTTALSYDTSKFMLLQFEIDKKPCVALISEQFRNFKHKNDFPYAFWITVETKLKNKNGHPVDEEADVFNKLEESLVKQFISSTPFCYIGRTTRDGYRELMMYSADKQKSIEVLENFISQNKFDRKITYEVQEDQTWEGVGGFYQ